LVLITLVAVAVVKVKLLVLAVQVVMGVAVQVVQLMVEQQLQEPQILEAAVVVVQTIYHLLVQVAAAVLVLPSFVILALNEELVELLLLLVATHITHSHQAVLTLHKDKKWKNYKFQHNFSMQSLAI
jgi:hypothetical protein